MYNFNLILIIIQVAKEFSSDFSFAISSKDEFTHELNEFGVDFVKGDKPVILAYDADDHKFIMKEEFRYVLIFIFLLRYGY